MRCLLFALVFFITTSSFAQDSQSLYNNGLELKQIGKIDEAIEVFTKSAVMAEDPTEAKYELAWCYNQKNEYDKALEILLPLKKKMSSFAKYFFELGIAHENMKDYTAAIDNYVFCLQINPKYDNAWYGIGYCMTKKGDYAGAIPFYKLELELNNEYKETVLLDLGVLCTKANLPDSAIKFYKEAILLNSKNYMPFNGLAQVYKQIKADTLKAIEIYREAIKIQPRERKAMLEIGKCYSEMGKYNQAVSYLKTALAEDKDYVEAFTTLGKVYYWLHDYTQSQLLLERAIQANPEDIKLVEYLLEIYIFKKRKASAIEMFNKLKQLGYQDLAALKDRLDRVNWPR